MSLARKRPAVKAPAEKRPLISPEWKTAIAGFVMTFTLAGTYFSFGVFVPAMLNEFGWSRAAISGAASSRAVVTGMLMPVVGVLTDRYGPRRLLPFAVLFTGLGYLSLFVTHSLWQLYLGMGLLVGVGMSASYLPIVALILKLFKERSALPAGILDSGRGIGQIFFSPLIAYLVVNYNWRLAFVVLAILIWVIAGPFLPWIARKPAETPSSAGAGTPSIVRRPARKDFSLREALKTVRFWAIFAANFVNAFAFQMVLFHIVAYATDNHISTSAAALIVTVIGMFTVAGALLVSVVARRIGNRSAMMAGLLLQAPTVVLLTLAHTATSLYIVVAFFALGVGMVFPLINVLAGELFGTRSAGSITGTIGIAFTTGVLTGPIVGGYIFDVTRSYSAAFIAAGAALIVFSSLLLLAKPPKKSARAVTAG